MISNQQMAMNCIDVLSKALKNDMHEEKKRND